MRPVKKRTFPIVSNFRSSKKRMPKPKKLAPKKQSIALEHADQQVCQSPTSAVVVRPIGHTVALRASCAMQSHPIILLLDSIVADGRSCWSNKVLTQLDTCGDIWNKETSLSFKAALERLINAISAWVTERRTPALVSVPVYSLK